MKKNLIVVSKLMLLCFIVVMVSSCGNVSKKLVGTWEISDSGEKGVTIVRDMKEDGTFQDKIISETTEVEEGIVIQTNLIISINGKWDATSKFYAIEYDKESAKIEKFELSFPSATEEEKAEYEEFLNIITGSIKTEGLKEFTSEVPIGRQQYFNLKVDDTQFSYLTEDGEETWKKVEN